MLNYGNMTGPEQNVRTAVTPSILLLRVHVPDKARAYAVCKSAEDAHFVEVCIQGGLLTVGELMNVLGEKIIGNLKRFLAAGVVELRNENGEKVEVRLTKEPRQNIPLPEPMAEPHDEKAETPKDKAARLLKLGQELFDREQYDEALERTMESLGLDFTQQANDLLIKCRAKSRRAI